jgi:anthranilate phosphoribosyltransferase
MEPAAVRKAMDLFVDPFVVDEEKAALLADLQAHSADPAVLAAFARELRRRAVPFRPARAHQAVDLCGSGGAPNPTFNVSTVSAFVVAAAGQPVIKHGNRSARGFTGSSDLLEALGLPILTSRKYSSESFRRCRLAFLHAPLYHPSTRAVVGARRMLGTPTIFNQLGPLSNPAEVGSQVVGVPDAATARRLAEALRALKLPRGMTVTSSEQADEFSPISESRGYRWTGKPLRRFAIIAKTWLDPEDRQGAWGPLPPADAAEATRRLLAGAPGARRGAVVLTAAAALWTSGFVDSWKDGLRAAEEALDSGAAEELLGRMVDLANSRRWETES